MSDKVIVEFSEIQLKLLDSLMPWFGTTREEVLKNILLRWAEQNIATKEMQALKAIGAIS